MPLSLTSLLVYRGFALTAIATSMHSLFLENHASHCITSSTEGTILHSQPIQVTLHLLTLPFLHAPDSETSSQQQQASSLMSKRSSLAGSALLSMKSKEANGIMGHISYEVCVHVLHTCWSMVQHNHSINTSHRTASQLAC
jgi:hypothetical protein